MKAWACAENSAPDVNSWSKPAIGTSCSVMHPVTVPCDTPTVGTSTSRAAWLLAANPASRAASSWPSATPASAAPTLAATVALFIVGTHVNKTRAPSGNWSCAPSKRQPCEPSQVRSRRSATWPMRSATCTP